MNLELLDPWEQEYPQVIEDTLEDGYVLNCRFNRKGTLLAAGCLDGRCVIWDFDTKGVSRNLHGHVKQVASISWSRNGKYLLSASKDWTCILWDLVTGKKKQKIRFDTQLMMAQMHPTDNLKFVAALSQESPVIVDMNDGTVRKYELPTELPSDEDASDKDKDQQVAEKPRSYTTAISWNKSGDRIYAGTSKGFLNVIDTQTRKLIYSVRITNTSIKGLQVSRKGRDIVVNANDRIIRVYTINEETGIPKLQNKFQDLVNRIQWNQVCFSPDGEFIIGGSAHKAEHNIYIWDKNMGNLVKILEGPKEPLDDLTWHPIRPVIASVSTYGNIHIWATSRDENWSAFAPDFIELEENLDYEEKEDEFDVVPEEEVSKRKQGDEDIKVDVATFEGISAFVDSEDDGEQDEIYHLPTIHNNDSDDAVDDSGRKKRKQKRKREKILAAATTNTPPIAKPEEVKEEFVEIAEDMAVDKKPKIW
ncbi:hypothetical protein K450DRAFT_251655 [Umbelopsis ramanniana AG]|uniref:Uncharacterized protein n=1 Tax=Umbelopsis ramanniana AG TaxID=1314678 RepID=A0AAD5HCD2_UMBRA|nr:uncharacterized protein K450DRAFT_251655 [Umbelopsis ramanniana AG]KAI8577441.1 hypothetical protein K450DRAFT_251655 [Umbelopsis ramanniana AG]